MGRPTPPEDGYGEYPLYLDERMREAMAAPAGADTPRRPLAQLHHRELDSPADVAAARVGELVELRGACLGNPLLCALDFVATMLPLVVGSDASGDLRPRRAGGTAATAAARASAAEEAGVQRVLMGTVAAARDGLRASPVVDVLVRTDAGLTAVLVLERALLGAAGEERLRDVTLRVLGKLTAVLGPDDQINLFRRTPIAATGAAASREMLAELVEAGVEVELSDPVICGPAVQILPLAVLV